MRKSKIETAETRLRIIAVASKVFLEKGMAATSIADVMAAAGLTQGGFYKHFESKEHLLAEASEAAFDRIFEMISKEVKGMPARQALDAIVRIYLYQRLVKDPEYLCPLAHLSSELPHADDHVKAVINVGYSRMVAYIASLVQQLNIADNLAVANAIVSVMLGAVSISRLALTNSAAQTNLAVAHSTVNLLLQFAQEAQASV